MQVQLPLPPPELQMPPVQDMQEPPLLDIPGGGGEFDVPRNETPAELVSEYLQVTGQILIFDIHS